MTDNETYCRSISAEFAGLSMFSALKKHPLIGAFIKTLSLKDKDNPFAPVTAPLPAWANFTAVFAGCSDGESFSRVLYRLALADVNAFTLAAERGVLDISSFIWKIAVNDLAALSRAAAFDFKRLSGFFSEILQHAGAAAAAARIEAEADFLAGLCRSEDSWTAESFAAFIRENGAGDLACHNLFYILDGELRPAANGDPIRLSDLSGYEEERHLVVSNTLRFLSANAANSPMAKLPAANNILLYGDRGCGKSATVKAVCNEYAGHGLRLVELRKTELASLPAVMKLLSQRGLRFILFIDDLSFESDDNDFMMLKAMLEGGIETKPSNVVIYATSNRRHLVKEPLADRPSSLGDVRAFDTMQEQLSLADRFGLTVIFSAPSQDEYLRIAEFIARKYGVLPENAESARLQQFRDNAVRWERWFNGRSPRTAAQFVEWLAAAEDFPWDVIQ
ncbi:MAG: ATP-binding protein [Spirochaetaceae bacterium]|jgi:predicted AAA+ superfamily ATPase|nr:ATP-binding protein [Spirochaetaceae bacterium]